MEGTLFDQALVVYELSCYTNPDLNIVITLIALSKMLFRETITVLSITNCSDGTAAIINCHRRGPHPD